jgi:GNAT superfamily N-acetyltransferase
MSFTIFRREHDIDRQRLQRFFDTHLAAGSNFVIPPRSWDKQFPGRCALGEYVDDGCTIAAFYYAPDLVSIESARMYPNPHMVEAVSKQILMLGAIAVDENYRRSGLGSAVLAHVETLAADNPHTRFIIGFIEAGNQPARDFFRRHDYAIGPVGLPGAVPILCGTEAIPFGIHPDSRHSLFIKCLPGKEWSS